MSLPPAPTPPRTPPAAPPPPPAGYRPAATTVAPATMPEFSDPEPQWQNPRLVLVSEPGWGKTSFLSFAPNPGLIMTPNELGYDTLLGNGLVPRVQRTKPENWAGLLALAEKWAASSCPFLTLGVDAAGGLVTLAKEHVIQTVFGGNRGDKGYSAFGKGTDALVLEMTKMLGALERISRQDTTVVLLAHQDVKKRLNPDGADYDRYVASMEPKVWELIRRWANVVLYGSYEVVVEEGGSKGTGGKVRQVTCDNTPAAEAKNQYGLPPVIKFINEGRLLGPHEMWDHVYKQLKGNN